MRWMALWCCVLVGACTGGDGGGGGSGGEPCGEGDDTCDGGMPFANGACEQFGVTEPTAVPASCGLDIEGDGATVRVFVVGAVLRYARMNDYASFCTAWDDIVRTQVLPCLAEDKPNLLVFPENATLAGAFIGSRGAMGRAETETLPAFLSLFQSYADPFSYYGDRYPDLSANARLVISLTDTLHRAFQTFPEMARQYEVYVGVSSDFAPAVLSDDPDDVATLADPDLDDVDAVYVATEGAAFNWGLYYAPNGQEIGRVAKSYLVPAEEDLLDLTHGGLEQALPVVLPFARTAMVISKDAWMPGLLERLDVLGTNVTLQPEAFSGWGVEEFEGDWLPDIVRQSGWAHTQRHSGFRYNVTPCIKGNLLELVFDCQSHITKVTAVSDPMRAFIGQMPHLGLAAVEPWVIDDPGPPASLEERRAVLRDRGQRMLPGSGDPLEDAYHAEVIAADLELPSDGRVPTSGDGPPGALGTSIVVAEPSSLEVHQRFPALGVDESTAIVAWMEGVAGNERVRVLEEAGEAWVEVELPAQTDRVQRVPRVALAAGRAAVVWEEQSATGGEHVVAAVRIDGTWTVTSVTEPEVGTAWAPDVAIDPVTGRFVVSWLDLRRGGRAKPWVGRSDDGQSWQQVQVDPNNAIDDNPRGDAAFVRVAANADEVFVAFSDFREFSWDVYLGMSEDGGATFSPAARVNPAAMSVTPVGGGDAVESERIHGDVALTVDPSGNPIVAWTDRQDRRYESRVRAWRAGTVVRIDDAPPGSDAWRPALTVASSGEVLVAWQDLRQGTNRVRLAGAAASDLSAEASLGVDDAADAAHVYAPQVGVRGAGVWVAWEDPRSGYARVRVARGAY